MKNEPGYIGGPMRGIAEYNFPAFFDCEEHLRRQGYTDTFNPARRDQTEGLEWWGLTGTEDLAALGFELSTAMAADLDFIVNRAKWIILLPGWSKSSGALHEKATADILGIPVYYFFPDAFNGDDHIRQYPLATDLPAAFDALDEDDIQQNYPASSWESPRTGLSGAWQPAPKACEERITDPVTGGQKGQKPERVSLIPSEALAEVSRVYGYGIAKYSRDNWRRGYDWDLSYDALQRHLMAFWGGQDLDPESGLPHLSHAGFHILTLLTFMREHPTGDTRFKVLQELGEHGRPER